MWPALVASLTCTGYQCYLHWLPMWPALVASLTCTGYQCDLHWLLVWSALVACQTCKSCQSNPHWLPVCPALVANMPCIGCQFYLHWLPVWPALVARLPWVTSCLITTVPTVVITVTAPGLQNTPDSRIIWIWILYTEFFSLKKEMEMKLYVYYFMLDISFTS